MVLTIENSHSAILRLFATFGYRIPSIALKSLKDEVVSDLVSPSATIV